MLDPNDRTFLAGGLQTASSGIRESRESSTALVELCFINPDDYEDWRESAEVCTKVGSLV